MRKVTLLFADVMTMTEFLLMNQVSRAITNTSEKQLKAIMSDKVLDAACKEYGAKIKESIQVKSFGD